MPGLTPFIRIIADAERRCIPYDVSIELTHHCNFRCQHCYIPDFHAPDLVTTERLLALLDELADLGTYRLTLTGGEMFLRRDWLVVASRARQLGFELRLFSNGATITPEIADAIKPLYATVEISLYSMDEAVFELITQKPGSFAKTIRGIELLRERGIEVLLKIPMMIHNFTGIDAVFEYAARIGAECQANHSIIAKKDGDKAPIALRVPPEQLLPYLGGPHAGCHLPEGDGPTGTHDGPLCAAATRFANITSAGDVMACNILPGSGGNIREKSFREIWETSPWLNKIRNIRRSDLKTCATCPKIDYCGRCHAQAMVEDGDICGPSSWACSNAAAIEDAAKQYESA